MPKIHLINFSIVLLIFNSCASKQDNYLNKGLFELQNKKLVKEIFVKDFLVKTFSIIKFEEKKINAT